MRPANGTVKNDVQFSVFLANKPQMLAKVCQQLADDKVNIMAMSMMDSSEHGVLRLVATDAREARESLGRMNVPTAETNVLMATLPNRPGALADVVERLSSAHVSVNYAYCTAGAPGGKTVGIFRVSDVKKASKVLEERQPRRKAATKPKTKTVRKPPAGRRK